MASLTPPSNRGPPVARLPARPAPRHPVGRPANGPRTPPQAAALRLPRLGWSAPVRRPVRHTRPGRLAPPERPAPAAQGKPARLGRQAATSSALARLLVSARADLSQERQIVRRQANGCHTNHLRFWLGLRRQLPKLRPAGEAHILARPPATVAPGRALKCGSAALPDSPISTNRRCGQSSQWPSPRLWLG